MICNVFPLLKCVSYVMQLMLNTLSLMAISVSMVLIIKHKHLCLNFEGDILLCNKKFKSKMRHGKNLRYAILKGVQKKKAIKTEQN